ncbi:hypothetical protein OKHIF_14070 [Mycobacteroides chelonae]|jgi:hypothetical protein
MGFLVYLPDSHGAEVCHEWDNTHTYEVSDGGVLTVIYGRAAVQRYSPIGWLRVGLSNE